MLIFECLALFLLSVCWPPPFSISFGLPLFQFLFLSLSPSLLLFFLSSFLSFFFAFFCFLVFVSFFPFLSTLLSFHERAASKYSIAKFFFINLFSVLVSCLVFSLKSLFLFSLFFPDFKLWVLLNINVFSFKILKEGVATKRFFFMNLCFFPKCEKLSVFGGHFWQILVDVQKN